MNIREMKSVFEKYTDDTEVMVRIDKFDETDVPIQNAVVELPRYGPAGAHDDTHVTLFIN